MAEIKYVGMDDLDILQRKEVESLVHKHVEILDRLINNQMEIVVHMKTRSTSGKQHEYTPEIRLSYPGGMFVSDKSAEWDLIKAMKHALIALEEQIKHKFH